MTTTTAVVGAGMVPVDLLIPRHSSVISRAIARIEVVPTSTTPTSNDFCPDAATMNTIDEDGDCCSRYCAKIDTLAVVLQVYTSGVVWNELVPMLGRNQDVSERLLFLMFQHSLIFNNVNNRDKGLNNETAAAGGRRDRRRPCHRHDRNGKLRNNPQEEKNKDDGDIEMMSEETSHNTNTTTSLEDESSKSFITQTINLPSNLIRRFVCSQHRLQSEEIRSVSLYIFPPIIIPHVDRKFEGLVISYERTMIQKQTMTAFMATLGGGYYMMKQLQPALTLARTQRSLALQLGNHHMAQQCLLNEAYNLLYAGRFRHAKAVLVQLEDEVKSIMVSPLSSWIDKEDAQQTLRQCQAARIWIRRLHKLSSRLSRHRVGVGVAGGGVSSNASTKEMTDDKYKSGRQHNHTTGSIGSKSSDMGVVDVTRRTVDDYYRVRIVAL
jgi:hypothetical protein